MTWKFFAAKQKFQAYRDCWDQVNKLTHNHILLDSSIVAPLLENFGDTNPLLGVYEEEQEILGFALIVFNKFGFWQTFQPAQAPLGFIIVRPGIHSSIFLSQLLEGLPGYALGFSCSQLDPEFLPFPIPQDSCLSERLEYIQTARITVKGSFEEYWGARPKEIVKNLDKRQRRMDREGLESRMVCQDTSEEMRQCVKEFGDLEAAGWKGKAGTAVKVDNAQGKFYVAALEELCSRGEGAVYKWLLNDEVVASNLCVKRNGTLIILKTAYSDEKKAYSPGLFLHKELLKMVFKEQEITTIEFYGKVLDWHRNFSDEFRQMFHLTSYRSKWVSKGKWIIKSGMERIRG